VVARDPLFAQALAELRRDALGHLARVDEDERRAVSLDQLAHARVDLLPLLVGADRAERRGGHLDGQVQLAEAARINKDAVPARAGQEAPHLVEGLHRGAEADALERRRGERLEPLQRQRQVRAPLVAHQRVDLVDDHGADGLQHPPAAVAREQQVERLGRRDQHVGGPPRHRGPLARRRVAGPHQHADLGQVRRRRADLAERRLEVLLDVVGEGPQRRDVEDLGLVREALALAEELVERRQERRERLARPGGRRDQDVGAFPDLRPALALRRRRLAEPAFEPGSDGRMEGVEGEHDPNVIRGPDPGGTGAAGRPARRSRSTRRGQRPAIVC
jgi:hypothetical protein